MNVSQASTTGAECGGTARNAIPRARNRWERACVVPGSALLLLCIACLAGAVGCGAPTPSTFNNKEKDPNKGNGNGSSTPGFGSTEEGDNNNNNNNGDTSSGQASEVWGHGPDTLYKLDPNTKAVTIVGTFSGCGSSGVTDVALDADSNLFATTEAALWSINKTNAACTKIAGGTYPNSLSFVPKGTVDPNVEALVGYEEGNYVRIDPKTGQKTQIGSIGGGLTSSGDIVSVKGGATYLTVTGGTACTTTDCLIEVNPTTGALVKNWGSIGKPDVYGLAFWAGKVYGFDQAGELFEVSFDGGKLMTTPIAVPASASKLEFWGAGSTTSAPVSAPK
jgi:hypothetical protein